MQNSNSAGKASSIVRTAARRQRTRRIASAVAGTRAAYGPPSERASRAISRDPRWVVRRNRGEAVERAGRARQRDRSGWPRGATVEREV